MKLGPILIGLLSGSPLAAQGQVWTVDDTAATLPDFTDLQTAVDTVADGDILLVKDGAYPVTGIDGLVIDAKPLTIQAEAGAVVSVGDPASDVGAGMSIRGLAASQTVQLRGLSIAGAGEGLILTANDGLVWIEDCSILCSRFREDAGGNWHGSGSGVVASTSSDVVLIRSELFGTGGDCGGPFDFDRPVAGAGLSVNGSNVHAFGCRFNGGPGQGNSGRSKVDACGASLCAPQTGGSGIRGAGLPEPFLFLSGCTVSAGDGVGCTVDWFLASIDPNAQFGTSPLGTLLVGPPSSLEFAGTTDLGGGLHLTVALGPLPPGLEGRVFFLQALCRDLTFQGAPPGSGKLRLFPQRIVLGEGSMLLGLDESF